MEDMKKKKVEMIPCVRTIFTQAAVVDKSLYEHIPQCLID